MVDAASDPTLELTLIPSTVTFAHRVRSFCGFTQLLKLIPFRLFLACTPGHCVLSRRSRSPGAGGDLQRLPSAIPAKDRSGRHLLH